MKVLHVIPAIGSVYGGPSSSVLELAQASAKLGIKTDIVTTNANGKEWLPVPLHKWISTGNIRIQYFPCWYFQDYKISSALAQWLFQYVRGYDLVNTHAIFSAATIPAYRACKHYRVPYIMHPHGMLEDWALAYKRWKKYPYYRLIEQPALSNASAIRVLAHPEAESLKRLQIKTPLALIPNGIQSQGCATPSDLDKFYQTYPELAGKTIILFLGRIDPKKGLDLLARAFGQIHQEFNHVHLVIAGPDNIGYLPRVKQYFSDVDCLEAVTFTGMLTGSIKQAALATADLYVAPSYSEGFSISVLEGMTTGLPCIITQACNFPEAAIARAAYVVEVHHDAIAKALIHCLQHPEEAKAMGNRARQFILGNYTWDKIAANLVQVYQAVIERNPLPAAILPDLQNHPSLSLDCFSK